MKRVYLDVCCLNRTPDIEKRDSVFALTTELTEKTVADIFLTVDDKLIKKSEMNIDKLQVRVENPVTWLQEVIK